jgi:hypothetical protein
VAREAIFNDAEEQARPSAGVRSPRSSAAPSEADAILPPAADQPSAASAWQTMSSCLRLSARSRRRQRPAQRDS